MAEWETTSKPKGRYGARPGGEFELFKLLCFIAPLSLLYSAGKTIFLLLQLFWSKFFLFFFQ